MHPSMWVDISQTSEARQKPEGDMKVDVAIVGGGITGISTAFFLHQAGRKVAVLEAGRCGYGTTGFSTGNMYIPVQSYFSYLLKKFDEETINHVATSRAWAIDWVAQIVRRFDLKCDFRRRPWVLYATTDRQADMLEDEASALQKAGINISRKVPAGFPIVCRGAISIADQARFNPLQFVSQFADRLHADGVLIYEDTPVTEITTEEDVHLVHTSTGMIQADHIITATHVPKGISSLQVAAAAYRSYVIGVTLFSGVYPDGNFWDLEDPHHAISTHSTKAGELDVLVVAGNHHKTGQAEREKHEEHYSELEEFARRHFDVDQVIYQWSAQHYQSVDGLPYIGAAKATNRHHLTACGFAADGLTYGIVGAQLLAEAVLDTEKAWSRVYDAQRHNVLSSAGEYLKRAADMSLEYLKDLPGVADVSRMEEIGRGKGKTIELDGEKLGVYRDTDDLLHVTSAVCRHMGCVLSFNDAETTWDCPCHGSRYTVDGEIIEGPTLRPLPSYQIDRAGQIHRK